MNLTQLNTNEYLPYFKNFLSQIDKELGLLPLLEASGSALTKFCETVPEDKYLYTYAENKWTLKEIISHLIDTERIFNYRALCIARQDIKPLQSYNENDYASNSNANNRSLEDLLDEFSIVRQSTLALFKSFTNDMLTSVGVAGEGEISVRAIAFIIAGHETHHINVFKERYL